ncbi:MAG: 4Fe-4S binding protein [Pelotomaculum sp.]|nr:4Fe-4S binding protein [Pelotomaculum sp.]
MAVDYNQLKKGGFIKQKQKDYFIVRFRSIAGNLTSDQLRHLAYLADKYGRGYVHITTRQGAEISWVNINDHMEMNQEIKALGLNTGTCGPRIRTVVACPGSEICGCGLMNTRETAVQLDREFFGRQMPAKVKIAVSGCPNCCARPRENDIGLVGAVEPVLCEEKCVGCGLCQKVCPRQAISMAEGKPYIHRSRCLLEGNCISSCPADAWQEKRKGYLLYIGGKVISKLHLGQEAALFIQESEVTQAVQKALMAFVALGQEGERMRNTVARIGIKAFTKEMDKL